MPGTFQVGSIVAELTLDNSSFKKTVTDTLTAAKKLGADLKRAFGPRSQIDFINDRPVLNSINKISRSVRRTARDIEESLQKGFQRGLKFTISAPVNLLRQLGNVAQRTGQRINSVFGTGIFRTIGRLRSYVFGLQGAFAALGVGLTSIGLIQRAREVETLRGAFENLSRSVGATADDFLQRLRKATKDTVSDLELMKTTNNAVLLGVVQSKEGFAELVEVARRLGRAVGRDTVDAVNDLTIGIGRQSRLILDNLGLIVKVGEATEKYAASIGKSANDLTDAERRQAFFNAAMEAGRQKVAELGPDVDTLNDAWGRFTARISNTLTTVSQAFVGSGIFNRISQFLDENQAAIAAYARFVSRVIVTLFTSIANIFEEAFGADTSRKIIANLGQVIGDVFRFVSLVLSRLLASLMSDLGAEALRAVFGLLATLGNAIIDRVATLALEVKGQVQAAFVRIAAEIPGLSTLLGLDDAETAEKIARSFQAAGEEAAAEFRKQTAENQRLIDQYVAGATKKTAEQAAKVVKKAFDEVRSETRKLGAEGSIFGRNLTSAFDGLANALDRLKLEKVDPFAAFNPLVAQREIQSLANVFNDLVASRAKLLEQAPELFSVENVKESGAQLKEVEAAVVAASDAFVALKRAPKEAREELEGKFARAVQAAQQALRIGVLQFADFSGAAFVAGVKITDTTGKMQDLQERIDALGEAARKDFPLADAIKEATRPIFLATEEFEKIIQPFTERQEALRIEVQTVGLTEAEAELKKFDLAFEGVKRSLSPEDLGRLDAARVKLKGLLEQREAAKQTEEATKKLERLDTTLGELERSIEGIEVGELASRFSELSAALTETLTDAPAEKADLIRVKFSQMAEALARAEIAKVAAQVRQLDTELAGVERSEAANKIAEMERGVAAFAAALSRAGIEVGQTSILLDRMRKSITELEKRTAFADLDATMKSLREDVQGARREMELIGATDLERDIAEITTEYERMIERAGMATQALIEQRIAAGADAAEIEELRKRLAAFQESAAKLQGSRIKLAEESDLKRQAREFSTTLRSGITSAIVDGVRDGEFGAKQFADIFAGFLEQSVEKAVGNIVGLFQGALDKIFTSGFGSVATGILGIAGGVLANISNRTSSTVDDFSTAVDSSESTRGVVAGPSNVAIAKVGESLKDAMRTTEVLLEQILQTIREGNGISASGSSGKLSRNAALALSTSSMT